MLRDVPIAKAKEDSADYYKSMLEMISSMVSSAIKDNDHLKFAVITGCLKITKESIFTGTNNFVSDTISETRLNEYFGFTQAEVDRLLTDTGLTGHKAEIKEWYDGYHFGAFDIYCPWDVMNHVKNFCLDPGFRPMGYWKNSSSDRALKQIDDRVYAKEFEEDYADILYTILFTGKRFETNLYNYFLSQELLISKVYDAGCQL